MAAHPWRGLSRGDGHCWHAPSASWRERRLRPGQRVGRAAAYRSLHLGSGTNFIGCDGEALRPHRHLPAVLPLQHVVLHALGRVLPVVPELHAPAVERSAERDVELEAAARTLSGLEIPARHLEHFGQDPDRRRRRAARRQRTSRRTSPRSASRSPLPARPLPWPRPWGSSRPARPARTGLRRPCPGSCRSRASRSRPRRR